MQINISAPELKRIINRVGRLEKSTLPMSTIAQVLRTGTLERFARSEDSEGTKWKPVARGGRPLTDSGVLKNSLTARWTSRSASVGTNLIYAAIHQFGGTIRPKTKPYLTFPIGRQFRRAKQVTITARPYLGLSEKDEHRIVDVVHAHWQGVLA